MVVPEDARRIIREQVQLRGDGLPWKNKSYYAQLMLDASLETYQSIKGQISSQIVFFDRGILDAICYMKMENISISEEVNNLVDGHPYSRKIFMLPPWKEIYETDNERKQTWREAVYTFEKMKQTYLEYGYEIIEVPKDTIDNRCGFVLESIK